MFIHLQPCNIEFAVICNKCIVFGGQSNKFEQNGTMLGILKKIKNAEKTTMSSGHTLKKKKKRKNKKETNT